MRMFKSRELVTLEATDFTPPLAPPLGGPNPSIELQFEESALLVLQDRRDIISDEIDRLRVELANTELAIAAREAARAVLLAGIKGRGENE